MFLAFLFSLLIFLIIAMIILNINYISSLLKYSKSDDSKHIFVISLFYYLTVKRTPTNNIKKYSIKYMYGRGGHRGTAKYEGGSIIIGNWYVSMSSKEILM